MIVVLLLGVCAGKLSGAPNPFTQQYRPTALEWLTVNLQANHRVDCGATDTECIDTVFQGHARDEIWVLSWIRRDVPITVWDKHVKMLKELIRLAADHDHLPMPNVKFLRKVGGGKYENVP